MPTESPQETWERMSLWDVLQPKGRKGIYPGRKGYPGNIVGPLIQRSPAGSLANALTGGEFPGRPPEMSREEMMNQTAYDVMDMVTPGPLGIGQVDAFHGSPHSFKQFKNEAMGTGEGAQAFGWGHYFTDKKDIAESYVQNRAPDRFRGQDIGTKLMFLENKMDAAPVRSEKFKALQEEYQVFENVALGHNKQRLLDYFDRDMFSDKTRKLVNGIKDEEVATGSLYKVQIHKGKDPSEYDYLDWDKPLTRQSESLKTSLTDAGVATLKTKKDPMGPGGFKEGMDFVKDTQLTGAELYHRLSKQLGSDKEASMFLLRSGIDGIRYPAGTLSGVKNSKAKNYVVFDPEAVTIEERINW